MGEVVQLVPMISFCRSDQPNQWIPVSQPALATLDVTEHSKATVLRRIDVPSTSLQALNRWLTRSHVHRYWLMRQVLAGLASYSCESSGRRSEFGTYVAGHCKTLTEACALLVSGVWSPIATTYFKMDAGIASRTKGRQGSVCLKNAAPWSGGSVWALGLQSYDWTPPPRSEWQGAGPEVPVFKKEQAS